MADDALLIGKEDLDGGRLFPIADPVRKGGAGTGGTSDKSVTD